MSYTHRSQIIKREHDKMIKIRISYTSSTDIPNILEVLQGFKILHIGKPKPKNGYYNMYLELE